MVIVAPPSEPGAVYATVAVVEPVAVAVPIVGAFGTVAAADEDATVIVVVPVALVDVVAVIV